MHTSSGQFSVFVQLPYNFPGACDLADEERSSNSLEVDGNQGDCARLEGLQDLPGAQGAWKAHSSSRITQLHQLGGGKESGARISSSSCHSTESQPSCDKEAR